MNHFTGPAVGKAELTIRGKKRCQEPFPINIGFDHNRRTKQLQLTGGPCCFSRVCLPKGLSSNAFDAKNTWLFPELSVQAEAHLGAFSPYVGGGVGQGRVSAGGGSAWRTTIHGLVGTRLSVGGGRGLRAEARVRGVGPTAGNTTDMGIGLTHRLL